MKHCDYQGANESRPDRRTEFNLEILASRGSDEEKLLNEESIKTEKSESSVNLHLGYVKTQEEEMLTTGRFISEKIARWQT